MIRSLKTILVGAALLAGAAGSTAYAAPTAFDVPAGDNGTYTYSNGQTLNNHFGTGTAFSGGFFFVPLDFSATVTGSGSSISDSKDDTVSIILNAKPNQQFTKITASTLGDYTIDGASILNSTGAIRVTNLDTSLTLTSPLSYGGTLPVSAEGDADGLFQGMASLDLPSGWTNIRVEMDGGVSNFTPFGSSNIQIKDAELGIGTGTAEIPIPGVLAVAPVAAFFGWRAKRKLGATR